MKKTLPLVATLLMLLLFLFVGLLSVRSQASYQEFWVPLVFPQGWPGNDFLSTVNIYALEDSIISIDGGSSISISANQSYIYYNPHIGTHIAVETGFIMAFYNWMVNDYGIWDDCPFGYTILPSSKLGSEYLIPIEGTVSIVATQPSTTVTHSESPTPITLTNPGDSLQFMSASGGWIEADKPIAVAVGYFDSATKSDTYAYTPLPINLIGVFYHFGRRVPMDPGFSNQVDLSEIGIMATEQGSIISIDGVVQPPLSGKGLYTIDQPTDDIIITSDRPISVTYLQRVQHSDPWNGELRYTSYAYSLVPQSLYGKMFFSLAQLKTHLIAETDVNVKIGSNPYQYYPAGVYDLGKIAPPGTYIISDNPVTLEEIDASNWAGMMYHAQGPAFEIFPVEFYKSPPVVNITIDIHPDTLNLKSKGKWITCYIELPEGYDVNDVNVSTVMLNDTVPAELHPTEVGDYDGDCIPDLMVKFDRAEVVSYILANVNMTKLAEEKFMTVTLTISGKLYDETVFQGSDTIRITLPVQGKRGIFPI